MREAPLGSTNVIVDRLASLRSELSVSADCGNECSLVSKMHRLLIESGFRRELT